MDALEQLASILPRSRSKAAAIPPMTTRQGDDRDHGSDADAE
jgi:hypothetical protein